MTKVSSFILLLFSIVLFSQKISSSKWTDLFSYNNILSIREDDGKLIAATENGIFFYSPQSGEVTKLSKANGLHEVKISAFDFNSETKTGLVGYENGSLDVISPEGIAYVVDIPIATGYTGTKRINHISISGNLAVISVDYGVSIYKLDRKEFGDSAYFLENGKYQPSRKAIIKDKRVFAVTASGMRSHAIDVTFPIFKNWENDASGDLRHVAGRNTIAYASASQVYYGAPGSFRILPVSFSNIRDLLITADQIIVVDEEKVNIYNKSGNPVRTIEAEELLNTAHIADSAIFLGSKFSGIITEKGEHVRPDGPYSNTSYKIDIQGDQIVVSSGGRNNYNQPIYRNLGYYHFDGNSWNYPDFFKDFVGNLNVLDAVINPAKGEEIFFNNFTFVDGEMGIYKMNNNELVKQYESTGTLYNRPGGFFFDENNNLFVSSFKDDTTLGFYVYKPASDAFQYVKVIKGNSVQKPIAKDGILYVFSPRTNGGILLYNYNNSPFSLNDDRYKFLNKSNNLPVERVVSAAVDKNDDLWIGTQNGLRILSNPSRAIDEDSPQTDPVIIEENGVGEELFRDGHILQIEVDSGNQKWVSVDEGGVFYISADGQKTLTKFSRENSPLPTNNVTDIKVDERSGKVYFVTLDGIVVYQGDVLSVTENFGNVLVYPNPVIAAQFKGNVKIRGLAEKTNLRITDAAGNLVHQAVARGGSYEWDLNNHRGKRVASGIYFVLMTNQDGTDTATAKIAVVN